MSLGPGADAALKALKERDEAFERGRAEGRRDIAKYNKTIAEIEQAVGLEGSVPMSTTVNRVFQMAKERDVAMEAAQIGAAQCAQVQKERDELRAKIDAVGDLLSENGCDCFCDCDRPNCGGGCYRCLACCIGEVL